MIILPGPIPSPTTAELVLFPSHLVSMRTSIANSSGDNYNDLTRYAFNLEQYIEEVFTFTKNDAGITDLSQIGPHTSSIIIMQSRSPWTHLKSDEKKLKLHKEAPKPLLWSLKLELELALIVISLVYTKIGSELTSELIESTADSNDSEVADKWKLVVNYYKKSNSFLEVANQINTTGSGAKVETLTYAFLQKINNISIQMSVLAKSSWVTRNNFNYNESFTTKYNGMLSRVAIYTLDELKSCLNLLPCFNSSTDIRLVYDDWYDYLLMIQKYVSAYSGMFLAIEYYQKDKLGHAIGLVNFSLLTLQSKKMSELKPKQGKILNKFKSKLSNRKNDHYITNLQSITTLKVNKSIFQDTPGIVLKDLSFLFDQLVQLHLKFTKENNNLKFDTITDWQDISKDSRWPIGQEVPTVPIKPYIPASFDTTQTGLKDNYTGKGSYF